MQKMLSLVATAMVALCCSCGRNAEGEPVELRPDRDNVEAVALVAIDDSLPDIHAFSQFFLVGDTLVIHDQKSTGLQFVAFDIARNATVGRFGRFGNGPGEIANMGAVFVDPSRRIVYGLDLAGWKILGFELDKAVGDSTYKPFVQTVLQPMDNGATPIISNPCYINDTTVICTAILPREQLEYHIGRVNLRTGSVTVLDQLPTEAQLRYGTATSPALGRIAVVRKTHDLIQLLDMQGRLTATIYGPDYTTSYDGRTIYFIGAEFVGPELYAIYSGKDIQQQRGGSDIVVMDSVGQYVKTLRLDAPIGDIAYHAKTDRLYVSSDGNQQFGYLHPGGNPVGDGSSSDCASERRSPTNPDGKGVKIVYSSKEAATAPPYKPGGKSDGPLVLLKNNCTHAVPVDITDAGAYSNNGTMHYDVMLENRSNDTIDVAAVYLPDSYFDAEMSTSRFIPGLSTILDLRTDSGISKMDYRIIVAYKDPKYAPQTFHINLHPDIVKLRAEIGYE